MAENPGEVIAVFGAGGGQYGGNRRRVELVMAGSGRFSRRGEQTDLGHAVSLLHSGTMRVAPPHVLVVRHGITPWNAEGRWQGWEDVPLSEAGLAQAERAGLRLCAAKERFDRAVTSDLQRARQTAEAMVAVLDPTLPLSVDPRWRERNVGAWSGLMTADIEAGWPGWLESWRRGELPSPPESEPDLVLVTRTLAAIESIAADPLRTIVVTHGGVIRTLERHFGVEPAPVTNVAGRWFGWDGACVVAGESVDLLAGDDRPVTVSL